MGSLDTWSTYHRTNILVACTLLYQFSIFLGVTNKVFPMFSHIVYIFPRFSPHVFLCFSHIFSNQPMFLATRILTTLEVLSFFLMPHGWAGVGWGEALTFLFTCRHRIHGYTTLWYLLLHLNTHTHTGCYVMISSLALADTLDATL